MSDSMPNSGTKQQRSRTQKAGESAIGLLLVIKNVLMALLAAFLLVAGGWTAWGTAQHAMLVEARERGIMTIEGCNKDHCWGPYLPLEGDGKRRPKVYVAKTAAPDKEQRVEVTVKPGTVEAVRTGPGGILYSWLPFAGSLLLASLVVAGGMRMRRTAMAVAALGLLLFGATFVVLM